MNLVMVPQTSIISESEVSLSAMFTLLHSNTNQELFEKYVCNQSSHYEDYDGAVRPSYHLELKYVSISLPCQLCSTRYTSMWINNCLKSI